MASPLTELFAEFEVARRTAKPSPHSERAARSDFAAIHRLLQEAGGTDDVPLEEVTPRQLRLAFARFAETHAAASIARCWSTWNQFYGFLVSEDSVPGNPMGAVKHPKVGRRTPKPLQGDDAPEVLLETVAAGARPARWPWPERDLAFLATALLTGLRHSELIGLNLGSIDGRPGERRIKVLGKGRKERTVPIEDALHDVIERYMETRKAKFPRVKLGPKAPLFVDRRGDRIKRGGAHYLVERSYRAAGLANRVPAGAMVHAVRHTFATRLAEDGASATEIQALLGHESLNTSQGYIDATAPPPARRPGPTGPTGRSRGSFRRRLGREQRPSSSCPTPGLPRRVVRSELADQWVRRTSKAGSVGSWPRCPRCCAA